MVSRPAEAISPELEWLATRPQELRPYLGQWVAILDERVIASGPTPDSVVAQLTPGKRLPLLLEVWRDDVDPDCYFIG